MSKIDIIDVKILVSETEGVEAKNFALLKYCRRAQHRSELLALLMPVG